MPDRILITGSSSGIGEAFAREYARRGNDLVLLARREQKLEALGEEFRDKYGIAVNILVIDLSSPDAPDAVLDYLREKELKVDVLVNNAGYGVPGTFLDNAWEVHRASNQLMITSVAELTRLLLVNMVKSKHGAIINVASIAGLIPASAGHTLYGAMKAWMIRFSESLHDELLPHQVKVLAVCPGFTYSEFHDVTGTRANVNKLPKIFWMSAEEVATQSLKALENAADPVFVPGYFNKFLVLLNKYLPVPLVRKLIKRNASFARNVD